MVDTEEPGAGKDPELDLPAPLEGAEEILTAPAGGVTEPEGAVANGAVESALQAKHAAEVALLREQIRRLEVEKELAELRAKAAAGTSESTAESEAEPASRAARRKREKEWDELPYVPVENYRGNPFRGPDVAVHLPNASRPQCFPLDHDPVHKLLSEQKTPMRYEYEILHPLLYYLWGFKQFLERDFSDCVLSP